MFRVDPLTSLGLNSDSIVSYRMGDVERSHLAELPELLPCGYLVGENNIIHITLKGETRSLRLRAQGSGLGALGSGLGAQG